MNIKTKFLRVEMAIKETMIDLMTVHAMIIVKSNNKNLKN